MGEGKVPHDWREGADALEAQLEGHQNGRPSVITKDASINKSAGQDEAYLQIP